MGIRMCIRMCITVYLRKSVEKRGAQRLILICECVQGGSKSELASAKYIGGADV